MSNVAVSVKTGDAIQDAINVMALKGGGKVSLHGDYLLTKPIQMESGVSLEGDNQVSSRLTTNKDIEALLVASGKNRFNVSNLHLNGNRQNGLAFTNGISLSRCSYFNVENIRVEDCNHGCKVQTCWCSSIEKVVALKCQLYAVYAYDTCTSLDFTKIVAWGTGGGFLLHGCVYCQIDNPVFENVDAGDSDNDPWLPEGSGGHYKTPKYLFYLAGSSVVINSPGAENNFSQYMYVEGSDVVILNPTVINTLCYGTPWRFIQLRGTAISNVEIVNPRFANVINKQAPAFNRNGLFVENAARQKLVFNRMPVMDDSFGDYKYSKSGIYTTATVPFESI